MKEGQKQGAIDADFKHVSSRLPAEVYRKLKLISVLQDSDIHRTFANAIEEYVQRHSEELIRDLLK
jgi:predicted DNA-binding protein